MKQNMTPKEKAKHLVEGFAQIQRDFKQANYYGQAKKSALLCVDVILNEVGAKDWDIDTTTKTNYWQDVETELSLL